MTQIQKIIALGAAMASVLICPSGFAQDDLDDLLKELEAESSETPAPAAEDPAPALVAEEPAPAPAAEEPAPAPAAEAPAPVVAPVSKPAPTPAAEEPVSDQQVDEVLGLLDALASESGEAPLAGGAAVAVTTAASVPDADAELLANIAATEQVRRQALDAQAKREINEARKCLSNKENLDAVRHYGLARNLLNDRASAKDFRRECDTGIAEGLFRAALQEDDLGRRAQAIELMSKAVDMRHPRARSILEKWNAEGAVAVESTDISTISHRRNDADYKAEREKIKNHLKRSCHYLAVKDLDKALEECDVVLDSDPYNTDAIRIRTAIQRKRQAIMQQERGATRDGMIADVDKSWRPIYANNAARVNKSASETVKSSTSGKSELTQEQEIVRRMKEMIIPDVSFKPPATISDAVDFFRQASKDYDDPKIPLGHRGFNFQLTIRKNGAASEPVEDSNDFTSSGSSSSSVASADQIDPIMANNISLYDAMKLVCESVKYKFIVRGSVISVLPREETLPDMGFITQKYNISKDFVDRILNATEEIRETGGFGSGSLLGSGSARRSQDSGEKADDRDSKLKDFFGEMGVEWPEGAGPKYVEALGKLYVRNTPENIASMEKVLEELGAQAPLIEVETRFIEVSQEDLNSLGFEWLMNSDYNLSVGDKLGRALGISKAGYQGVSSGGTTSSSTSTAYTYNKDGTIQTIESTYTPIGAGATTSSKWMKGGDKRNLGIGAIAGVSDYKNLDTFGNGNRFLSTTGNRLMDSGVAYNDQFMRVNAFLGNADLSMILHMLAQRTDTDLLSAPKIVTRSGEQATIKVVTEYIYPTDYEVQLSQGSNSQYGSSQSLAIVQPQTFTKQEVGVVLEVTPIYSEANGGMIELELHPSIIDEPTWKNYGMKIPFSGNTALQNFDGLGQIFTGLADSITAIGTIPQATKDWIIKTETSAAEDALENLTSSSKDNMSYYEAPMEQPFFHIRSIETKIAITPGSTVILGGLITESRKAMDDKVPFLGDLPFVGRLFRSHSELTVKRNLLIFVTGRLITPSGREMWIEPEEADVSTVRPAPTAE